MIMWCKLKLELLVGLLLLLKKVLLDERLELVVLGKMELLEIEIEIEVVVENWLGRIGLVDLDVVVVIVLEIILVIVMLFW